jgi:hypothetical protein
MTAHRLGKGSNEMPNPVGHVYDRVLPRNTDTARWALGLKPCRHVPDIAVDISAIWNYIADIDADGKRMALSGSVGRLAWMLAESRY